MRSAADADDASDDDDDRCLTASLYTVSQKTAHLVYCPYLCQLLTDFQNSFTGALAGQFSIK